MEHAKRRQLLQGPFFVCPLRGNRAFTLIELIGVLAIISILAGMIAPNVIGRIKAATQDAEVQNLKVIAQGIELYLRKNRDFPATLSALSPEYVPFPPAQLTSNTNDYPRYYFVQSNLSSFSNATGLTSSELADARFLVISQLNQDAAPTIINDAQFESWWNTDETSTQSEPSKRTPLREWRRYWLHLKPRAYQRYDSSCGAIRWNHQSWSRYHQSNNFLRLHLHSD